MKRLIEKVMLMRYGLMLVLILISDRLMLVLILINDRLMLVVILPSNGWIDVDTMVCGLTPAEVSSAAVAQDGDELLLISAILLLSPEQKSLQHGSFTHTHT